MGTQLEVMIGVQSWRFQLEADRTTVGKALENDISIAEPDRQPSARDPRALPGRLVRYRSGVVERDLGQRRADLVLAGGCGMATRSGSARAA